MKQKLVPTFVSAVLVIATMMAVTGVAGAATPPPPPPPVGDIESGVCAGINFDSSQANTCDPITTKDAAEKSVNDIIATVINVLSLVVGVVSVIMIIIGGLKYITSGGDSTAVSGAKNTILYALVGLVIVVLAQVIVRFVLGRVA